MSLKSPLFSQNLHHQITMSTAWFTIGSVICAHNRFDFSFPDTGLKLRKIRFPKFFHANLCIKIVSFFLRAGMYCKMLGTRCRAQIFSLSLQTFDICNTQYCNQCRVFSISLMSTPPAGIPEEIDIGRPKCNSFINITVFMFFIFIIFGSRLRRNGNSYPLQQFFFKSCSKPDCLWKNSCCTRSCNTMQALIPPVILRNIQMWNFICVKAQL